MNNNLKRELPFIIILLLPFIIAALVYPQMPDQVPIHWNAQGQVDDYASKGFGTFLLPVLNVALYLLLVFLPKTDPKKANYQKFNTSYRVIRYATHCFFFLIFIVTLLATLGNPVDINLWIPVAVAVLFIIMGNVMGRVRHNYYVGFRFPWTLANETVWKKTHQVGAKAMVIGGVAALIGIFLVESESRVYVLLACVFLPMIFITVYSYLIYKKNSQNRINIELKQRD